MKSSVVVSASRLLHIDNQTTDFNLEPQEQFIYIISAICWNNVDKLFLRFQIEVSCSIVIISRLKLCQLAWYMWCKHLGYSGLTALGCNIAHVHN